MANFMWHIVIIAIQLHLINAFSVKVLNVSKCDHDNDLGELRWDRISPDDPFDQEFTGTITLPFDIGTPECAAAVEYISFAFDENEAEWKFLFKGRRSLCNSITKSIPYENFSEAAGLPLECPLPKGEYRVENFPISGQYALLSDIQKVGPLVKSIVTLKGGEREILCRKITTLSE